MKSHRSAPVLLIGFGLLIGLIAVSGIGALQRARRNYRDVSALNERYRRTDRILNAVASGISTMGLLARDFLLDPSNVDAAEYRSRLMAERSAMEREFRELHGSDPQTRQAAVGALAAGSERVLGCAGSSI